VRLWRQSNECLTTAYQGNLSINIKTDGPATVEHGLSWSTEHLGEWFYWRTRLRMEQNYKSDVVNVNNTIPPESVKSRWPSVPMFVLGFLVALQVVQFVLTLPLYQYVLRVEDRMNDEAKEAKREIIKLWKKG